MLPSEGPSPEVTRTLRNCPEGPFTTTWAQGVDEQVRYGLTWQMRG